MWLPARLGRKAIGGSIARQQLSLSFFLLSIGPIMILYASTPTTLLKIFDDAEVMIYG